MEKSVRCDRRVSARLKRKVYQMVRPSMLSDLETVALRKRQEAELERGDVQISSFSLGVTRMNRIKNKFIRKTVHVRSIGKKVREARLRWLGHGQRRDSEYQQMDDEVGTARQEV